MSSRTFAKLALPAIALLLQACAQPSTNCPAPAACPACPSSSGAAPAASAAASASGSEIVATVGSENITRADLEKSVRSQLTEVDNQRYEILEEGLGNMVSEKLLTME